MVQTEETGFLDVEAACLGEQSYSFDMGGTMTKLVYIDTQADTEANKRRLRFKVFSSSEPQRLVEWITSVLPPDRQEPRRALTVTGVCAVKHRAVLEEGLHVTLQVDDELQQFGKAIAVLLNHCAPRDVFEPASLEAEGRAMKNVMDWAALMQQLTLQENNSDANAPGTTPEEQSKKQSPEERANEHTEAEGAAESSAPAEARPRTVLPVNRNMCAEAEVAVLPCLHVMLGSATGFMKVDEQGRSSILNGGPMGGKYFMGLARLATGVKDFSEMIALAERGVTRNVDLFGSDTKAELGDSEDSGLYTAFPDDQPLYGLGKLSLSDEKPRKEDLLASLFHYFTSEVMNLTKSLAQQYGLKRVYFTGGFLQHEYVRGLAEEFMATFLTSFQFDSEVKYGFLQHGNMYGALGCLLTAHHA